MEKQFPKILIVDDKPENLFALEKLLKKLEVEVIQARSGSEALKLSLDHDFCLVIADIQMPQMDGYEFVELLRSNESTATLPVIFVSAIYSDEYHHRKAYDSGAVDFMSKPFIPEILLSKVRVFIDLYEKRRSLQTLVDGLNHANAMLSRRTMLLETTAKLSQQITSILNLKKLLMQVTGTIQAQFTFPWVSIWLINDDKTSILLEAGPKSKVELGTAIPFNHPGLVGQACRTGNIALDNKAGKNPVFIASPGMPNIFSELAIPLKFLDEIMGAVDIQSERLQAFDPEDVTALHLLFSQIAVAIRNAKLYSEVVRLNTEFKQAGVSKA
jgi:CheY-like chemotaxis protein